MSALKEMDENLKSTDDGYVALAVMVASSIAKAEEEFLASELGYDKEFVFVIGKRLRDAKIWKDDQVDPEVHKQWMNNPVLFWIDAGNMIVVRKYKLTERGLKLVPTCSRNPGNPQPCTPV